MPKMKTHRGARKRIKVTGTGKFVIKHSGKSHILTKKDRKRKNNLKKELRSNWDFNKTYASFITIWSRKIINLS
mgnify:CR=1 FL=1